ncbi:MAG: SBBP repeat-containing protein, partial [Kiritimatiellae bacterium]|nr:SBBP repeat-containing protein [Kiritimatiellia bacterium]
MASRIKHGFLFVLGGLIFASIACAEASTQSAIHNPQSAISLRVPFIRNQGQIADSRMLFYARTFGGTVYVTAGGDLVYALPKGEGNIQHPTSNAQRRMEDQTAEGGFQSAISNHKSEIPRMAVIRETLVDADLTALPTGAERSGAIINSFIGNDPCRWQANIPSFTGVQFGEIYEGISLEVRAAGDNVEKIFTVAPGADPARIALRLAGAEGVRITPEGELEARTALGPVRFTAPVAYQKNAAGERQGVSVAYALEGDQVGFCLGAFDAARPLVIDPLLASTFIGGMNGENVVRAMALDSRTNVLVAGYTAANDFPATNGYETSYQGGSCDGFIAKFDPQLTNLLAATYLGGSGEDKIMAMAVNTNNGDIYVVGYTASADFPVPGAVDPVYGGNNDAFVSVLSSDLTALTASTYLGGANVDQANALTLNMAGEVYVAGYTASCDFPTNNTAGATYQNTCKGSNDAFVTKFNSALSARPASTYVGGSSNDQAFGLAVDTNGLVYIAGATASANFPALKGYKMTRSGASDAFVAKLYGALTNMAAATYLGGASNECANGIAVAPFTNIVCVVGYTDSANFPVISGSQATIGGLKDAFLTRFNMALSNVLASTYLGGADDDQAMAVLTSATSNTPLRIYVAGRTASADFPVTPNAYNTAANGNLDAFVSYFGAGAALQASTYLGGITNDTAYAMALQADRYSLFVAGATASTNFPATLRAYNYDRAGQTNDYGFVTKLGSGLAYGTIKWQVKLSGISALAGSPSLGWDGSVYFGAGTNLYAFDAQGRRRWVTECAGLLVDEAGSATPPFTTYGLGSIPAVSTNGTIYVTIDLPGSLQAISPTGGVKWTNSVDSASEFSSPAIGSDGTVYFGSFGGRFYAVRDNGDTFSNLWNIDL